MNKILVLQKLNIKPSEFRPIGLLILQSTFIGIFIAYYYSFANGLFLSHFDISYLPYAYLTSGLIGFLASQQFSRFQRKISYSKLMISMLIGVSCLMIFFKINLLIFGETDWLIFLIFICFMPVSILTALGFWGMSMKLFDLRQGKRLFPVLASGEVISGFVGFISVPIIINATGSVSSLLYLAILGLIGAIVFQVKIGKEFGEGLSLTQQAVTSSGSKNMSVKDIWGNMYYRSVVLLSVFSMMALVLVDFSFLGISRVQFPDKVMLTSFIGYFFSMIKILEFVLKTFLSGRLIQKYGLAFGLGLLPLLLLVFTSISVIALFGEFSMNLIFLSLAMNMYFLIVVKKSIEDPSFKMLFQPLEPMAKMSLQALAEGKARQIGMIAGGGILILINVVSENHFLFSSVMLLIVLVLWLGSVKMVRASFKNLIYQLLKTKNEYKKSQTSISESSVDGKTSFQILESSGKSQKSKRLMSFILPGFYPDVNIEKGELLNEKEFLDLLKSPDPKIKSRALTSEKIYNSQEVHLEICKCCLGGTKEEKKLAISSFLRMDVSPEAVNHALMDYNDLPLSSELNFLITKSKDSIDVIRKVESQVRKQGVDIINDEIFQISLMSMLHDDNSETGLYLFHKIESSNLEIRHVLLSRLLEQQIKLPDNLNKKLNEHLRNEINWYSWLIASYLDLEGDEIMGPIIKLVENEMENTQVRIIQFLSLIHGNEKLSSIKSALESEQSHEVLLGLEMLESTLDKEFVDYILPLYDQSSPKEKNEKLAHFFPQKRMKVTPRLRNMVNYDSNWVNIWLKINALKVFSEVSRKPREEIISHVFNRNHLIRQMAFHCLYKMDKPTYFKYIEHETDLGFKKDMADLTNDYKQSKFTAWETITFLSEGGFFKYGHAEQFVKIASFTHLNQDFASERVLISKGQNVIFVIEGSLSLRSNNNEKTTFSKGAIVGVFESLKVDLKDLEFSPDLKFLRILSSDLIRILLIYPDLIRSLIEDNPEKEVKDYYISIEK